MLQFRNVALFMCACSVPQGPEAVAEARMRLYLCVCSVPQGPEAVAEAGAVLPRAFP